VSKGVRRRRRRRLSMSGTDFFRHDDPRGHVYDFIYRSARAGTEIAEDLEFVVPQVAEWSCF